MNTPEGEPNFNSKFLELENERYKLWVLRLVFRAIAWPIYLSGWAFILWIGRLFLLERGLSDAVQFVLFAILPYHLIIGLVFLPIVSHFRKVTYAGFVSRLQELLLPKIVEDVGYPLEYNGTESFSLEEVDFFGIHRYKKTLFHPRKIETRGHLSGYIEGVKFNFAHVVFLSNDEVTIHNGIYIIAEFDKELKGETNIISTYKKMETTNSAKRDISKIDPIPGELVLLEDPSFHTLLDVQSTDQIEAREILTPIFMEKIIKIEKRFGGIWILLKGKRVHISVPITEENRLDSITYPDISKKISIDSLNGAKLVLSSCFNVIKDLKSNKRLF